MPAAELVCIIPRLNVDFQCWGKLRAALVLVLCAGNLSCRIDNPGFGRNVPGEVSRLEESSSSQGEGEGDPPAGDESTAEHSSVDGSGPSSADITVTTKSTGESSSSSETATTAERPVCGLGERYCYPMKREPSQAEFAEVDDAGPRLGLADETTVVRVGPEGGAEPFDHYVNFDSIPSILGMKESIVVSDLQDEDFVGMDFVVDRPSCAFGETRCAFAHVANIVLSVDAKNQRVICSSLGPDQTTLTGEMSGPLDPGNVNRIGCGVLGRDLVMYVNGVEETIQLPVKESVWIRVTVKFGTGFSWFEGALFHGSVGVMRYWDDQAKMKAALADE